MNDTPRPSPAPHEGAPFRLLVLVGAVALLVRLLHNQALLADPLHYVPLGGNLPLLEAAEAIAAGDLLPFDGPISVNSPLYPYILAALYALVGEGELHTVRVFGAVADSATCALVALLGWRRFGSVGGWVAGLAMAVYGPLVFFSTDLNPVPWTLLLLVGGIVLLDGKPGIRRFGLAGLLLGLAAATRPNVLLAVVPALAVPWARAAHRPGRLALAVAAGALLGVAPVTSMNLAASGRPVLLTTSAGHNFYIGHNPRAEAQYTLPAALDGDIFATMKSLAEEVEGRPLGDTEVSGWYLRRGIRHVLDNPAREVQLLGRRALLLVNDFEATTYANYDYQRFYSPVLRWAPTLAWLLVLAAPGALLALRRRHLHLWIPLLTGAATVLLFFYIARLRIVMVPSLAIFAGAAVARASALVRRREWRPVAVAGALGVAAATLSALPVLEADTSNEWNKAGGLLTRAGYHEEAAAALERALEANPLNPDTYRNLAVLYRRTERPEAALRALDRARELEAGRAGAARSYRDALTELGGPE